MRALDLAARRRGSAGFVIVSGKPEEGALMVDTHTSLRAECASLNPPLTLTLTLTPPFYTLLSSACGYCVGLTGLFPMNPWKNYRERRRVKGIQCAKGLSISPMVL